MIHYKVKTRADLRKVERKAKRNNPETLAHGAATVRLIAKRLIRTSPRPAPRGQPPRTRGRKRLRKAILFAVDKIRELALIGPSYRIAGISGAEHEHGADWRKPMDERPFMGPALEKAKPKLPREWEGFLR